jgi:hypothetical protein
MSTTSGQNWCKSFDWRTSNVNKNTPVVFCCSVTSTQAKLLRRLIRRVRWMRGWASFSNDMEVLSREFLLASCTGSDPDSGGVQSVNSSRYHGFPNPGSRFEQVAKYIWWNAKSQNNLQNVMAYSPNRKYAGKIRIGICSRCLWMRWRGFGF